MRMPVSMSTMVVVAVLVGLSCISVSVSAVSAQLRPLPQGVPPRDRRPVPPQTGTGSIRGRVVDGVTGQPIARAQVRINGRRDGVVTTDASGTFAFTNLPAGRFTLYASKSTYLNVTFPEPNHSLRAPRAIDVDDGQDVENVTVTMFHGGVITGLIVDAHGDPVENVMITARRV